ncbi:MAG: cell surface protein SprA [Gemmatimonadaceae bacterium]
MIGRTPTFDRVNLGRRATTANRGQDSLPELAFTLNSRLEVKGQHTLNERCTVAQYRPAGSNCNPYWTPTFNFQFDIASSGVVADRVHVDLDYNSLNEFGASNNISVRYEGKPGRVIESAEIGNISFLPPPSRFITSGIPSGNYGLQVSGKIGSFKYSGVAAQQRGNVSKDRTFTMGDRTRQKQSRAIEDVGMELRRFFMTVDPRQFAGYPNVDILNRQQMLRIAASLPDSVRPTRLLIYKQLIGATNPNPRGPQLSVRGARNSTRQIYEVLRENVDYYVDPSQLWIALVAPLAQNERLAVAYEVRVNGVPGRNVNTGGTPDIEYTTDPQFANLLWEPELQPNNPNGYFQREIKSVYRLGGDDIRSINRESIALRIVTGTSGDQEKPRDVSRGQTYLQLFGMSQITNTGAFDVENRVWPRPQDPNRLAGATTQKLIRDNFIVFPSLQPFARAGLAQPFANPANDTLYTYPNEYLYSTQRPQSIFRLLADYLTEGTEDQNTLALGVQQIRPRSEHVLLDGQPLVRDGDYTINYELGIINFNRGDTLFLQTRQVTVRFEENLSLGTSPTTILGLTTQLPLENGQINFTAISQRQQSQYNRPPLGYESAGSLVAGVTANFSWDATALTRAVNRLPFAPSTAKSRIGMLGEIALSRPQPNAAGQAYLESFENNAGRSIALPEASWALSSLPAAGTRLTAMLGGTQLTLNRNATIAFQNVGLDPVGKNLAFTIDQIDPRVTLRGAGLQPSEQVLWLSMLPLKVGGFPGIIPGTTTRRNAWTIGNSSSLGLTPSGRRFSSIQTVLNPSGDDLSSIENIEFFALVQVDAGKVIRNPTLVLDFGDISENRVAFAPETLTVSAPIRPDLKPDTTYQGKRLAGYDTLNSERDKFSRAFNAVDNDVGIAGSVADSIIVVDKVNGAAPALAVKVPVCTAALRSFLYIGDNRANCTVRNNRLDEEDIDLDGQLNLTSIDADKEQWKRFVVDLADTRNWARTGKCRSFVTDSTAALGVVTDSLCWVQIRLNWRAPTDSLNSPNDRRIRAMRLTMVSAAGERDDATTRIALAKFELIGAPWLRRADRPLSGIAGDSTVTSPGYVISSVVGTQDSSLTLHYQSPPGVLEEPETKSQLAYDNTVQQQNEHSLRLQAGTPGGQFPVFSRAESYYRFPQGNNTFMGYRTLRLWMRGRKNGWGDNGELNAFVRIGRDANNFYLYRTPVQSGETVAAWDPEVRVDLTQFQALRAQLENNTLRNNGDSLSCSGADLELIKRSGLPRNVTVRRYAVCAGGYIVYSADPGITPPNLAGVQEMAVGFVRIDSIPRGANAILPGDSLELWIDDVRLSDVVADVGFAGEIGLFGNAGDLADFRLNLNRRDPNFRQLGETPSFLTSSGVSAGTTFHLERMLPRRLGIVMPLSVNYGRVNVEQLFINQTDVRADGIRGLRNPNDSRTDYALAIRRATPVDGHWFAPLLNGLALSAAWGHGNGQSTFQDARNNNYSVTAALNIDGSGSAIDSTPPHLPRILDRILGSLPGFLRESQSVKGLRSQDLHWRPSRFQVVSGVAQNANSATSYLKPVMVETDTGFAVRTESHLWQNSSTLEFRPLNAILASFSARQTLDLRNYGNFSATADSANRAAAAQAEHISLFGQDLGLERERTFVTALDFRPGITNWFQPGFRFSSNFSLFKDPNARYLLKAGADSSEYRLPNRLGSLQTLESTVLLDLGRLITTRTAEKSKGNRLGRAILPVSATWSRTLTSNYDNTVLNPGIGYQFGLGGVSSFRGLNTQLATGAGRLSNVYGEAGVQLPLALTIRSRFQHGNSETWTRRVLDDFQALITNDNQVFPNLELSWNLTLKTPNKVLSGLSASFGYVQAENNTLVLSESGSTVEQSRAHSETQPMSLQVNWTFLDGFRTGVVLGRSLRQDSRPGTVTRNDNPLSQSYTIGKDFSLPADWKARSKLKTIASYVSEGSTSIVQDAPSLNSVFLGSGIPSVLTNNGRRQYNFQADTDLSETLSFSLTGSHTTVFDRNYNRQTVLTVFSTILQIHFGSGDLKK